MNIEKRKAELREYIAIMNNALDDGESARIAEQLLESYEFIEFVSKVLPPNAISMEARKFINKIGSADE